MKRFIAWLKAYGYTQAPWNECPQGFQKANYKCYKHKDYNVWVELYIGEGYGHVFHNGNPRGDYFRTVNDLKKFLNDVKNESKLINS